MNNNENITGRGAWRQRFAECGYIYTYPPARDYLYKYLMSLSTDKETLWIQKIYS